MEQMRIEMEIDSRYTALTFVQTKPDMFRPGFEDWLPLNWFLYQRFEQEANRVAFAGREHWSANTIIEYLRHETMLRDRDSEFKFNDRWTSSMARLYALMNPRHADLFEFRQWVVGGVVSGNPARKAA